MGRQRPRILFLDAYDSFSNNIISLLETTLDVEVHTLKIDDPTIDSLSKLTREITAYDAVVCGPGPGHPQNDRDIGAMKYIWRLEEEDLVPVLGICLGFQSLCLEFGADIKRLKGPQHGIVRRINHAGESGVEGRTSVFEGVGEIKATLYQSLCADIGQDDIPEDMWNLAKWRPTKKCPDLLPLAWVESELTEVDKSDSGIADRRVFVGVRHKVKPFWALQYHPESICTNKESEKIIRNWFKETRTWSKIHMRKAGAIWTSLATTRRSLLQERELKDTDWEYKIFEPATRDDSFVCHTYSMTIPHGTEVPDIVELLQDSWEDNIVLESSNALNPEAHPDVRGRYSIIGLNISDSQKIEHRVRDIVPYLDPVHGSFTPELPAEESFWPDLAFSLEMYHGAEGHPDSPFWGGLIGYTTYELGLEGIDVDLKSRSQGLPQQNTHWSKPEPERPDACFVLVLESIVIDHQEGKIYFQKLDQRWREEIVMAELTSMANTLLTKLTERRLSNSDNIFSNIPLANGNSGFLDRSRIDSQQDSHWNASGKARNVTTRLASFPSNETYENKVRECQEYIRSGDSYELCLTDQSIVEVVKDAGPDGWEMYKKLRRQQPAPFASYLRMGGVTLVSASPERFLKWDREGNCELRPMKGTVRKTPGTTLEQAKALLNVPKEIAENLMIVDLVRHDLHGICGSGNVNVPKLMVVEEYQSVYQMISIVQGKLPASQVIKGDDPNYNTKRRIHHQRFTGIDVLAASLPPGSMTGAPKKRSCEILQDIEHGKERSMYSGVVGYIDVGGRGDFSVTIRCMFKWADENREEVDSFGTKRTIEKWHVGAGGAVTTLSTPEGEREEMFTKARGTLGIF